MSKILIIDDDKELCLLIKQSVLYENIIADCCYSGKSGLEKLKDSNYQLVILDVMMQNIFSRDYINVTRDALKKEVVLGCLLYSSLLKNWMEKLK